MLQKSSNALKTISEVADIVGVEQHVLRFWETKFDMVTPVKRKNGRRYYRNEDVELLRNIKYLLHDKGYTIKGAIALLESGDISKNQPLTESVPQSSEAEEGANIAAGVEQIIQNVNDNNDRVDINWLKSELNEVKKLLNSA